MWDGQVTAFRILPPGPLGYARHGQDRCPDDHRLRPPSRCRHGCDFSPSRINQAIIVGHSLGGFISLRFNVMHPDRVKALVLQGAVPDIGRRTRAPSGTAGQRPCQNHFGGRLQSARRDRRSARRWQLNQSWPMRRRAFWHQCVQVIDSLPGISVQPSSSSERATYYLQGSDYMARPAGRRLYRRSGCRTRCECRSTGNRE